MGWCVSGTYEKSEKEVHATVTSMSVDSSCWKRQMPSMKKELGLKERKIFVSKPNY